MVKHHRRGCEPAQDIKACDALCPCSHLWSSLKLMLELSAIAIPPIRDRRGDQDVTSSRFREGTCSSKTRHAATASAVGW
jgi:hypothetical protein